MSTNFFSSRRLRLYSLFFVSVILFNLIGYYIILQKTAINDIAEEAINIVNEEQMLTQETAQSIVDLAVQGPAAFLRNYVLRRGFLDGSVGFTLSCVNAYAVFLKFAKLWELENAPTPRAPHPRSQEETEIG